MNTEHVAIALELIRQAYQMLEIGQEVMQETCTECVPICPCCPGKSAASSDGSGEENQDSGSCTIGVDERGENGQSPRVGCENPGGEGQL